MATENDQMVNGDTPAQPATDQTDPNVLDQVAPDQTNGDTPAQPATDASTQDTPQVNLQAELEQSKQKLAEMEQNYQALQTQVQMMATTQPQIGAKPQAQPQQAVQDPYADYEDYDYVPLEAARQAHQSLQQTYDKKLEAVQEQVFFATHQDYEEVVGKADPMTGQFLMSEHVKAAITKNPALVQWIKQQPDSITAREAAYRIAKQEMANAKPQTPAPNTDAQALAAAAYAENSAIARTQPGAASAAGGDGAVNKSANVEAMPDDQFDAHEREVLAGRFDKI